MFEMGLIFFFLIGGSSPVLKKSKSRVAYGNGRGTIADGSSWMADGS
jgi:hypothetical protein